MIHFFADSSSLKDFVSRNDVTVWHGSIGLGTLSFIDTYSLHVVFDTRKDYEDWLANGKPEQICLF